MGARGKLITKGNGVTVGADIYELPVDDSQPFSPYYDKRTVKVFERLPADAHSQTHYRKRGLVPGYPPKQFQAVEETQEEVQTAVGEDASVLELLKAMQAEIKDLKNKLAAKNGEAPSEPVQLSLL